MCSTVSLHIRYAIYILRSTSGIYRDSENFLQANVWLGFDSVFLREDYHKEEEIRKFHGQNRGKLLTERDERCPTSERVAAI
jgi:hypothetical protein